MGIDVATWRARIGLNYCRQSRYACRPLPVQWRAARWGVGEVMNSTPLLLQGCMAVVSLSLILGYTFRGRTIGRCGRCGKVCRPKLRGGSVPSAEVRGMADTGIIGVCLLLGVCAVVLALLLMAGDVERNPGPTGKEGSDQVDKILPTVDDTPLGEDDLLDVLEEMMPVVNSWKAIGRGLRIDSGHLEMIQKDNPGDSKECLSEMLTCWLKRNYNVERFGEPTWRAVVKVVARPAAGDNCALALSIAKQHLAAVSQIIKKTPFRSQEDSCASTPLSHEAFTSEGTTVSPGPISTTQSKETQKPFETGSQAPPTTTSSFPYLKESGLTPEQQEGLSIRLCVESEDIICKFWRLHSRVYKSLCEQNISVDKLVTHLLLLDAFDPVSKATQKPALHTFFQKLQNAGSIEKVLFIIKDYFSFFNCRVIEHIVDGLGTDQDRVELQNYKKEFDEYSKRRIYECPPVYGPKSDDNHALLVLKLDSVYEKFTVKELKKFEYRLSRIFCVSSQSVLRLCRVEEGCLQLIFQVPSFVQQEIFPLSNEQEKALAAEGVIRLICGDYQFTAKRDEDGSESEDTGSDQVDKVLSTVDSTPLGDEDRFDILTEMMPVASSWKAIGTGLRIDSGHLNMIQESNSGKPKECLSEMLSCWLNRNYNVERFGEPTWRAVVKVVAHPAAGDNCALALTIAKQHLAVSATVSQTTKETPFRSQEDSHPSKPLSHDVFTSEGATVSPGPISPTQRPLETGSPTPTSITSSFPYLKVSGLSLEQQEGLRIRLRVESEDIVRKFGHLHSRVYESLCERNVPVDKLVTHLLSLGAFDPVHKESQKPALQTFFQELRNARSIEDVLYIIRNCISFFNYHVIEHIVNELGTDQDRAELQNYERNFDEYSKRRVYECPPVYEPKSDADHVDLVVKVDSVYEEFTVKELKKFQYRLSRVLHVSPQSVLHLCKVEKGCLQLIFQIPSFVQQEIFPLSSEQERALAAEGLIRLTCEDYQFATKGDEDGSEPEDTEPVPKLRVQVFQAALTVHDIDADSAIWTRSSIITDDRSSCSFSDDEEDPLSKELDELDEESKLQISSGHQLTESTPELHLAARRGDLDRVKFLIDSEHPNPLQKDKYGYTALHAAAQGGSLDVLKYFIDERNCNPACLGQYGGTPLHDASDCAHLDVVKYLVTEQQVEPLCQKESGWTPLHISCRSGCLGVVKILTEEIEKYEPMKDLMPSLTTKKKKNTPLHLAAVNGHLDIVQFFVTDLKCSPNIPGFHGRHPIHYAAERDHLHIVKYLIDEQGCDPSCLKTDKSIPLHQAARNGHLDIVKYLTLEKHCNPTSRNSSGITPIHQAVQYGHLEILKFFLTDLKCSPNVPGKYGRTPLHLAAGKGHLNIMKYLIHEQQCDTSFLDEDKQTPLHYAAAKGHLDIVKFLTLEKHCNQNQRDIRKNTPLHTAAKRGRLQVVKFFIKDLKCPLNIRGQRSMTPRQLAETKGHHIVALYLEKRMLRHSTN